MSEFAKNLRKYRKQKKLTQTALGEKIHYGYTAIANYESGRNEPSYDVLISLAQILEVTPNDLLGFPCNDHEHSFLKKYQKLPETNQKLIKEIVDALQS